MSMRHRLFIMIDIETSGPIIGTHSMTELGAAVGSKNRGMLYPTRPTSRRCTGRTSRS